jgi:hypothetical protein
VKRKHNFIKGSYGGMKDTPVAKRFDMLYNSFHTVAEIDAMSNDLCNALIEELRTLKIKFLVTQVLIIMRNNLVRK